MSRWALLAVMAACSPLDVRVADGLCAPEAVSGQTCVALSSRFNCERTEAERRQSQCDLATIRPEVARGFVCDEGIEWRDTFYGDVPNETCSYGHDGALIGSMSSSPSPEMVTISGAWAFNRHCVETDLCPVRDAGSCRPIADANHQCREDFEGLTFCASTESAHRVSFCRADAGSYQRLTFTCTGATRYLDVASGIGPNRTCFYADGGLIGASWIDDTSRGTVWGQWTQDGCSEAPLCQ